MRSFLTFLMITLMLLPEQLFAAACCGGRGPKSFISLSELQTYEFGISLSTNRIFGRYNVYGEPEEADHSQFYNLTLGVGVRLLPSLEVSAVLPLSRHEMAFGSVSTSGTDIGDVVLGGKLNIVRSLFRDDWYPTVGLVAGIKAPTGSSEKFDAGKLVPGTGNGLWEPFVGISLKKEYGFVTPSFDAIYTMRFATAGSFKEGDKMELTESLSFPLSRRLGIGGGSTQSWVMAGSTDGKKVDDTQGRSVSVFASGNYFFTQFWSVTATFESSVPVYGLGVNQQLAQAVSITTKYAFF